VDFVRPVRPVALSLVSGRGHYDAVIQAVVGAQLSVWIATANLKELMIEDPRAAPGRRRGGRRTTYRSILEVLDELAGRGVEVRLLHAGLPSRAFARAWRRHPRLGRALRSCPRLHFKAVVVDGALLYLGSANWTGAGLGAKGAGRRNFELGVVTDDTDLLDEVQGLYDAIWRGAGCKGCKLRSSCDAPIDELVKVTSSSTAVPPGPPAPAPGPTRPRPPSSGRPPPRGRGSAGRRPAT
jgi:phosphatidylserine/phosphatidylglycerophosphate/cardiolipin synthase-like enzyme